jgi:sialate O-acetylesterase
MIVTTDVGDATDIHPPRKEPVGARLALAARALAYNESIEYMGPVYESMRVQADQVILTFSHANSGLVSKGGTLQGFTISGESGQFTAANAEIDGDKIIISSEAVQIPKAVRYGWSNVPEVNLFNKEGLPASPFRTDQEK